MIKAHSLSWQSISRSNLLLRCWTFVSSSWFHLLQSCSLVTPPFTLQKSLFWHAETFLKPLIKPPFIMGPFARFERCSVCMCTCIKEKVMVWARATTHLSTDFFDWLYSHKVLSQRVMNTVQRNRVPLTWHRQSEGWHWCHFMRFAYQSLINPGRYVCSRLVFVTYSSFALSFLFTI